MSEPVLTHAPHWLEAVPDVNAVPLMNWPPYPVVQPVPATYDAQPMCCISVLDGLPSSVMTSMFPVPYGRLALDDA